MLPPLPAPQPPASALDDRPDSNLLDGQGSSGSLPMALVAALAGSSVVLLALLLALLLLCRTRATKRWRQQRPQRDMVVLEFMPSFMQRSATPESTKPGADDEPADLHEPTN